MLSVIVYHCVTLRTSLSRNDVLCFRYTTATAAEAAQLNWEYKLQIRLLQLVGSPENQEATVFYIPGADGSGAAISRQVCGACPSWQSAW
jgi:hypothetical protein